MKKVGIFFLTAAALILLLGGVSATCLLSTQLINQEPYPAVPGDYVKLVFQVSGLQNPDCNYVSFQLVPKYPISFDPGVSSTVILKGGNYVGSDYSSDAMVPYKVRVDPNALNGENPVEVLYSTSPNGNSAISSEFNLSINNTLTDFNVYVKSYDSTTNDLTLEILNIGQSDAQALTVTLPKQNNFTIKGSNVDIIGLLDSNDYTTADFQISPNKGYLNMTISYTDSIGVRRSVNKTVYFDPSQFEGLKTSQSSSSATGYIIVGVIVVLIVVYIFYRRHKKNKKKKLLRE